MVHVALNNFRTLSSSFIFFSPELLDPKNEAGSDPQIMRGRTFDAVMAVFGLDEPDTKPFLDCEINTPATRNNESVAECVEREVGSGEVGTEIVSGFDTSSAGGHLRENSQPVVRTN